ncbi:MAG: 4-(cytidine 5'-diphospho)-2-C-methyl-D-erythritol kinase [Campylobacteraceae bacterium]|nr:4-(cytidine 5'-diphospho)-2-C-methyl-D-erythritol kinase [Campylobacteraceae bacterium]
MTINAFAKVNIFLKVTGTSGDYHTIASRFVLARTLFDTISFIPKKRASEEFLVLGDFGCSLEENTIFKAYKILCESGFKASLDEVFKTHAVYVTKRIPKSSGLGGGSSDAASFLLLCNEVAKLKCRVDELSKIGLKVGADVPFFIYNYTSANVEGIGEKIEFFEEDSLDLELKMIPISCETKAVYSHFRKHRLDKIDIRLAKAMLKLPSRELLKKYDAKTLNDLLLSTLSCYPKLKEYLSEGWCMSGSGSTLFRIKNE